MKMLFLLTFGLCFAISSFAVDYIYDDEGNVECTLVDTESGDATMIYGDDGSYEGTATHSELGGMTQMPGGSRVIYGGDGEGVAPDLDWE